MTDTVTKRSSALRTGDVVRTHGMRVRLGDIEQYQGPYGVVTWSIGTVLNLDEVRAAGIVPAAFLRRDGREDAWNVQGNDSARWEVEA